VFPLDVARSGVYGAGGKGLALWLVSRSQREVRVIPAWALAGVSVGPPRWTLIHHELTAGAFGCV